MLYLTTRNSSDAYTAQYTLRHDRGPDGGLFVPFYPVRFSEDQLRGWREKSFSQCVADLLNMFFSVRLDSWDVDFCIGRHPIKLVPMSHRIMIAENWNNPEWDFARVVRNLSGRMLGAADIMGIPSNWAWIGIRIAVIAGIFGELSRLGVVDETCKIDVCTASGDFTAPMALWYAREMGLPIGTIIFSCTENSSVWELLHHGELRTDALDIRTAAQQCDAGIPTDIERLIFSILGKEEIGRFLQAMHEGRIYSVNEEQSAQLRAGMFCAVVSQKRISSVIRNVYRTSAYIMGPYSALAYSGLQDYRAANTEAGQALILTEQGPLCAADAVAASIGMHKTQLYDRLRR